MYDVVGRGIILTIVITDMTLAAFELEKVCSSRLTSRRKGCWHLFSKRRKAPAQKISQEPNKAADKAKLVLYLMSITARIPACHDDKN
jgi:hypothetical protein